MDFSLKLRLNSNQYFWNQFEIKDRGSHWNLKNNNNKKHHTLCKGLIVSRENYVKRTWDFFLAQHGRKLQERRRFLWPRNSTGCHAANLAWTFACCCFAVGTYKIRWWKIFVGIILCNIKQDTKDHGEQNQPNVGLLVPFLYNKKKKRAIHSVRWIIEL